MNPISLRDYAERFLSERDVCAIYRMQVRLRCRMLCEWSGRELAIADLNCQLVNDWLAAAKSSGVSAYTANTYRANILAVWNAAYMDGLTDAAPLRLRRIKRPHLIVKAYSHEEIGRLLASAAKLRGTLGNGNARSIFWQAFLHAAYDTGLRRGDLLAVKRSDIQKDGTTILVQSKTQRVLAVRFTDHSLCWMRQLHCREDYALPWPGRLDSLVWAFRRLRRAAGLSRGSLKWIRRSAASYAERDNPGSGARLLGHQGDRVFRESYEDPTITRQNPFQPPPLTG